MPRQLPWILALIAAVTTFSVSPEAEAKRPARRWGGFGHGFGGMLVGDLGGYDPALAGDDALGIGPIVFGGMLGGGGRALVGGRLMIGGKGYALLTPPKQGTQGQAQIIGGGGGFDLGVALYNEGKWLVYPYAGVQGFGMGLTVANDSDRERRIGDVVVDPGASQNFGTGFPMIELGTGVQRLQFGKDHHGGFMVGLELGFLYAITGDAWQVDEMDVQALGAPSFNGAYLRLTVGGGGFMFGPKHRRR